MRKKIHYDGYARLITGKKGELLEVEELYCNTENIRDLLEGSGDDDFKKISYKNKNARIIVFFVLTEEKFTYGEGVEYDCFVSVLKEIVLIRNYKKNLKLEIIEVVKYSNFIGITIDDIIYSSCDDYLKDLAEKYFEWYGDERIIPRVRKRKAKK